MNEKPILLSCVFVCCVLKLVMSGDSTTTDVYCLQSILKSFHADSANSLNWDFTNSSSEGSICEFVGIECWHPKENRVLNINLRDMNLRGRFPVGIVNCTTLMRLDLSGNQLTSTIPSNISLLIPYVTSVNLSNNNFSGAVPAGLANCSFLNELLLDHNRFSGAIPLELGSLPRLKVFDVAGNDLKGEIPSFNVHFPAGMYGDNPGLCGAPLPDVCRPAPTNWLWLDEGFIAGGDVGFAFGFILVISVNFVAFNMFI